MENVYTAQSLLQKWLTSREPTNQWLSEKSIVIPDYLSVDEGEQMIKVLSTCYPQKSDQVSRIVEGALAHLHPVAMVLHAQFQAITDTVFKIDDTVFSSKPVCSLIKKSEFVFPHIITTGKEIEDYVLDHPNALERQVIRQMCARTHLIGQNLVIEELVERYGVEHLIPILPGEPGWALFEGTRIFDLFADTPKRFDIYLTEKGVPNVANTSYGLMVGN